MTTQHADGIDQTTTRGDGVEDDRRSTGIGAAMWIGSAATHASALALMGLIYWSVADDQAIELPPAHSQIMPEAPRPTPPETRTITNTDTIVLPEIADTVQPDTPVDVLVKDPGDPDILTDVSQLPKGVQAAQSDVAMSDSAGLMMVIGPNGNAASPSGDPFGRRGDRGKKGPPGAPPLTVDVDHALRWFKRHQSPNGMWEAVGYFRYCNEDGARCEPGKAQSGDTDVAMTGYAVLCFLGDGYDPVTPSRYRNVVRKGVDWLIANQKPDGLLGQRNYEHAIAAMALAQAYAMAPEPALRGPAQKAVDIILARQNRDAAGTAPYDRLGWDYNGPNGRNDASVTGWNVMALKSAMVAGLNIGDGLTGGKAWLSRAWKAANTGKPWCASPATLDPYTGISRFGYVWKADGDAVEISPWDAAAKRPASIANQDLAPVGLMCAAFLGHRGGDPMLESLANYVSAFHLPAAYPCNTYYLYYNTLGMYQVGGERWSRWAKQVLPMLHDAQHREEGCMDGSWDWQGTQFHGNDTGRVLSTAYACLSMQVYWIYSKVQQERKKG